MVLDVPAPKAFSVQEDPSSVAQRWKKWLSSFEIYLKAAGITKDEQKAALLLHIAGLEVQEIFATLTPIGDDLKTCLNAYIKPKANIRYERFLFSQCVNEVNEKIDTFVTKLKHLADSCELADLNDVIIDQVIAKCNAHELRKKLLQEKNLTLDKVVEIARVLEASNTQAQVIEGKVQNNAQVHINKLSTSSKKPQKQWRTSNSSQAQGKSEAKQSMSTQNNMYDTQDSQHKVKGQQPKLRTCYRCGKTGHHPRDRVKCPATDKQCNRCGRKGHFSSMCRFRKAEQHTNSTSAIDKSRVPDVEEEFAFQINSLSSHEKRLMVTVTVNDKLSCMLIQLQMHQ